MKRSWWQRFFTLPRAFRLLSRPRTRPPVRLRLALENLEERETPAVTAMLNGTTLRVDLSAAGDQARIGVNGANLEVSDGTPTVVFTTPAAGVTAFDIAGTSAGDQTVVWNDTVTLTGDAVVANVTTLTVNGTYAVGGVLTANFAGPGAGLIEDGTTGALTVTGNATLNPGATRNIVLDNAAGHNFSNVAVTNALDVTLRDTNALALGASTIAGILSVTTAGALTQTAALTVTGATTVVAGAANDVTLNNAANDFQAAVAVTSGNNVALTDTNALALGASTVSGTFGVTANGAVTQTGALTVTGATTLAAGAANNITLNNAANDFQAAVGVTSGNNVALTDANAIALGAMTVAGTLTVTANGAVTQTGALTVTGTTTVAAGAANNITLNNAANDFQAAVAVTSGNNVALTDANAIVLGASTVAGTLTVTANGPITQTGALVVTGAATFAAGAANDITLNNAANDFQTSAAVTTGNNVALTDANALALGASTIAGTLTVTANGAVTQTGALTVTGTTTLAAGAANNITLNNAANDFQAAVAVTSGNNVALTDANAIVLGASTVAGTLTVTTNGPITQTGALTVAGAATFAAGAANDITLNNAGNDFQTSAAVTSGRNVALTDANALALGASTIAGTLTVTANGAVTQTGALTVTGTTTVAAGAANNVTLNNAANDFQGAVAVTTGNNVALTDANALALGASTIAGTLTVTANGAITQTGPLTVTGTTTLAAGAANDITLGAANDFQGAVAVTSGRNVVLTDANAIALGASTIAGTLSVTANGAVTQTGALTVGGTTTVAAGAANNVTLNNAANDFQGAVAVTSGNNVALTDANALALGASTIAGTLTVTANGAVTQTGPLTVTGTTTLAAGAANDITLGAANDFQGAVAITAGRNVTLTDANAIVLGASTIAGTLSVTAGGPITQTGALTVAGAATFAAGAANNVTLNNAANDFQAAVAVTSGNNVALTDANALALGASTVSGTLAVTANGAITQTGALTVVGTTTIAAGAANNVTLNNAGNDFQGAVAVTTGNNVALTDANALALGASTIAGTLTVTANGAITQTGPLTVTGTTTLTAGAANDITLGAANNFQGAVTVASGRNVTLTDANALVLGASPIAGTLTVTTNGAITQTGPLTVAGVATFAAGAANDITLGAANDFQGTVVITSGNNVIVTDANALTLGTSTVAGTLTATATDNAAAGDDLTVAAGATVRSTGANVILRAGDNLTLVAGSLVQAAGTISLVIDFGNADAGTGATATFAGASLNAPGGATVLGGPDDDTFNLSGSATAAIAVDGAAGNDTLNFNALNNPVTLTPNSITAGALQPVTFTNIESVVLTNSTAVNIAATAGNDTLVLSRGPGGPQASLNGGPAISIGETPFSFDGLAGTNTVILDYANGTPIPTGGVTFANVTVYTVNGSSGDDVLVLQRAGANSQYSFNGGPFINLTGANTFQFNAQAGSDTMRALYAGGDPVPAGGVVFDGGPGPDRLGVFGGGTGVAVAYRPSPTTPGSGTVTANGRVITFQNLTPLDLTGFATVDVFLPNANDTVQVQNGFDFTAGGTTPALVVSGDSGGVAFETLAVWDNTTVNLNTTAVDGNDAITFVSADNAHNNTNLNVTTGAGTDVVTVNGPITLAGTLTIASQQITVNAPITSTGAAGAVTLTNGGTLTINNTTIAAQGPVTQNGTGPVALTGNVAVTTATGAISFLSPITAGTGTNQFTSTGSGAVTFTGTYNGPAAVTVTTGGTTTFTSAVGNTTPLALLLVNGGGTAAVNGPSVTTSGPQTYAGNVTLGMTTTAFTSTGSGAISFNRTLTGASAVTVNTAGLTAFGGAVSVAALTTDTPGRTDINGGTVTTTGDQTYNDDVTLTADAVLNGANVRFARTVNSDAAATPRVLTVNASGVTEFRGAVGTTFALAALTTDTPGRTDINGGTVTTTGDQTYNDDVTLTADAVLTGANVRFARTVNSDAAATPRVLTVNASGVTEFRGAVGTTFALAALTTDTPGRTDINGGTVTTTGDQTYNDDVTLTADAVLTGANVRFARTVNSDAAATPRVLTVNASGVTEFRGAVGTTFALAALTTDTPGRTDINGGTVTTTGDQTYNDDVTLTADAVLTGANVRFARTVNSDAAATPRVLTVNASGVTEFRGAVGTTFALAALTTDTPGRTDINGGTVTTTGDQTYNDDVTLTADAVLTGANVRFARTVNSDAAATPRVLTVNASGVTEFRGAVGTTFALAALTTDTPGRTDINGGTVTTTGDQTYNDDVTLTADAVLTGANVRFARTVNSDAAATPRVLTVNASGVTEFRGAVGTTFALAALTTDTPGRTDINGGTVTTTGDQTYNDDVTLTADAVLTGANVRFARTVNSDAAATPRVLTVNASGVTEFRGAVGTTFALAALTTDTPGRTDINGGTVTTTGDQTYNDDVTLTADAVLTGANVRFARTVNSDAAATPRVLTVNASGVTEFRGAVGTTFALAALTTDTPGRTDINGGTVTTTGDQTYNDDVTLGAATGVTTLDTTANGTTPGGNLTFGGLLDGTGATGSQCLAARPGTGGDVLFNGAVGSAVALGNVAVQGARDVTISAAFSAADFRQVAGTGTTRFNGATTLSNPVALDVTTLGVVLNANVSATNAAGAVRLNPLVNGVSQTAGALTANSLLLNGSGAFALSGANNDLTTLAALVTGPVTYRDANNLTVGTVTVAAVNACGVATTGGTATGITTGTSDITLTTGGSFTAVDPTAATLLNAGGAAGGFVTVNIGPQASVTFNAEVSARRATFNGSVTPEGAFGESFTVRPSQTTPITINGNLPTISPGDALSLFVDNTIVGLAFTPLPGQGNGMFTFGNRQTLDFTSIERLAQLSISAIAVQTGPRPIDFQILVQGQFGSLLATGRFALPLNQANPFIVSPLLVNPVALVSAPRLAVADVNGDGIPDLIVAGGTSSAPLITVISGQRLFGLAPPDVIPADDILAQFYAYDPRFLGGVYVVADDFNGDGRAEIVTGADAGGGPHVRTFEYVGPTTPSASTPGERIRPFGGPLGSFFAYNPGFLGGVRVAVGDVDGDGRLDIITGAGPGGGPHVAVFSGATGAAIRSFYAYAPGFLGGVFVDAADFDGDGLADILTGPGFSGGPHVRIFSGATGAELAGFLAFPSPTTVSIFPGESTLASGVGGVAFTVADVDNRQDDILVTTGRGTGALAVIFRRNPGGQPVPDPTRPFSNPGFLDGVIPALVDTL